MKANPEEVYKVAAAAQERMAYFLATGNAAAVGFALTRTEGPRSDWMIFAGLAVAAWGVSFAFCCQYLLKRQAFINVNLAILQLEALEHPASPADAGHVENRLAKLHEMKSRRLAEGRWRGRWMYWLFLAGMGLYAVGHVWRVWTWG